MKKILLFIICVLFLTGCNISITSKENKDGSVLETVEIKEQINNIYLENQSLEEYKNDMIKVYEDTLNEEGYTYSSNITENEIIVTLTKQFNNLCNYFNESLFVELSSNNMNCKNLNGNYEIKGNIDYFTCEDDCMEPPLIDNAIFTIEFKKNPLRSNSKNINQNSYTWNFNSYSDNKVEFIVKKDVPSLNSMVKNVSPIKWVIIFVILMLLLIIIGFILYRKHKKTKIDY